VTWEWEELVSDMKKAARLPIWKHENDDIKQSQDSLQERKREEKREQDTM
jgi:hypothetical protein